MHSHAIAGVGLTLAVVPSIWVAFREPNHDAQVSAPVKTSRVDSCAVNTTGPKAQRTIALTIASSLLQTLPLVRPELRQSTLPSPSIQGAGCLFLVGGALIRYWSYQTLGKYFTFTIKVQKGQKIIRTGPYAYVRHPAYLGGFLMIVGMSITLVGPYNYGLSLIPERPILSVLNLPVDVSVRLPSFLTGLTFRSLATAVLAVTGTVNLAKWVDMIRGRTEGEEEMMRAEFGAEWDEYSKSTAKIVPFVY